MSRSSDAALLGVAATFEFDPDGSGAPRQYPFAGSRGGRGRPIDVELRFASWLEGEAWKLIKKHEKLLGPAEADGMKARWHQDCAARVYAWGGARCRQALYSLDGLKEMALLQFQYAEAKAAGRGQPSRSPMTAEVLEKAFADPAKADELAELVWEPADPNPPAGEAEPTPSAA